MIHADDVPSFQREVLEAQVPVLVDFWAAWCGPCRMVVPELDALAEKYGAGLKVVKVDVDANLPVAAHFGIQSIPTLALFHGGEMVARSIGARPRHAIELELGLAERVGVAAQA